MSSFSYYDECTLANAGASQERIMQCVGDALQEQQNLQQENWNKWLLNICGTLVFSMQAGFAMVCAGCVRKKNLQNTMLKNFLDVCGVAIAFYAVGYSFAFGDSGGDDESFSTSATFVGDGNFFLRGDIDLSAFFFQYAMSAASVTIVAGTLEERCQMRAYLLYSIFLSGFVYPVVAHALWSTKGWLSPFKVDPFRNAGAIDFAGSGVIHLTGGTTGIIAACLLGPRRGRFTDNHGRPLEKPRTIAGHSVALQVLGTMILWFGWYGFNSGSALLLPIGSTESGSIAARAVTNTSISGAAGAVSALAMQALLVYQESGEVVYDLCALMNGALSGLVAITACSGTLVPTTSLVTGIIAGLIYLFSSKLLVKIRIDDAVDAIPVHLFNGAWGMIAAGLFSAPGPTEEAYGSDKHVGWFYSLGRDSQDTTLLVNQLIAVVYIMVWCCITMIPFFAGLNYMQWLRTDVIEELVGLDKMYNGVEIDKMTAGLEDVTKKELKEIYEQEVLKKYGKNVVKDAKSDERV